MSDFKIIMGEPVLVNSKEAMGLGITCDEILIPCVTGERVAFIFMIQVSHHS